MPTNFPTSLDALTNPTAADTLDSVTVPHADQHANANDAIEALQAKVGIDSSADPSSLDKRVSDLEAGGGDVAETYFPASIVVTNNGAGSIAGTVADTNVLGGGYWELTEGDSWVATITWAGVTHFNVLHLHYRYYSIVGNSNHDVAIQLWNVATAQWDDVLNPVLNNVQTLENLTYQTADGVSYIDSGVVVVRITHGSGASSNHRMRLDHVILVDGPGLGDAIVTSHEGLSGRSSPDQHPASSIMVTPAGALAATNVQAALEELDADLTSGLSGKAESDNGVTGGDSHDHSGGDGAPIPAAGLDTDNSAADGDLMSYSGTTGKLTWLKSVTYQPSGGTAVTGTVTAGTYADAQVRGGVAWTIQEVVGVPGFDVQLTFSTVENFNEIRAYMRYQGGGSHLCEVGLKNGDAATFTTLTSFNSQNGLTDVIIQVDNGPSYIATDGSVTVRFYHPITGNGTTHFLYLDLVNLILAVTGGGGVTDHRALSNRLDPEAHPDSAITVSTGTGLVATDLHAALLELNTEKIKGSGVAKITVGTAAPGTPATGDIWIDTN